MYALMVRLISSQYHTIKDLTNISSVQLGFNVHIQSKLL